MKIPLKYIHLDSCGNKIYQDRSNDVLISPRLMRLTFPSPPHSLKPLRNNTTIKFSRYPPLGVTYHQVIEPIIFELVTQFRLDDLYCRKSPLNRCG
jgi:hypothetical protein